MGMVFTETCWIDPPFHASGTGANAGMAARKLVDPVPVSAWRRNTPSKYRHPLDLERRAHLWPEGLNFAEVHRTTKGVL